MNSHDSSHSEIFDCSQQSIIVKEEKETEILEAGDLVKREEETEVFESYDLNFISCKPEYTTVTEDEEKEFLENLSLDTNKSVLKGPLSVVTCKSENKFEDSDISYHDSMDDNLEIKEDNPKNDGNDFLEGKVTAEETFNTLQNIHSLEKDYVKREYNSVYWDFECHVCEKKFSQKDRLKRHMKTHTYLGPYECEECKRTFSRKDYLTKHRRIHSEQRSFECRECEKKFSRKYRLKNHMTTHTGERPFECKECKRKFSLKALLKKHSRIHTGEKPYECGECQRKFSQKGGLKLHMITHILEMA